MNPHRTYSDYLERYGEEEGKQLFLQCCEFMSECEPFPTNLQWCEAYREIKNENDERNSLSKATKRLTPSCIR